MKVKDLIELLQGKEEKDLIIRGQSGIAWVIDLNKTEIKNIKDKERNIFTLIIK